MLAWQAQAEVGRCLIQRHVHHDCQSTGWTSSISVIKFATVEFGLIVYLVEAGLGWQRLLRLAQAAVHVGFGHGADAGRSCPQVVGDHDGALPLLRAARDGKQGCGRGGLLCVVA